MAFGYIYLATNLNTAKRYIGQTTQPVRVRWMRHVSDALGVKKRPHPLHNSIRKHGAGCWRVETLCEGQSFEELNVLEAEMILSHGTLHPNGYNLKPGGNNAGHHAETKKKLGDALRGRKLPAEICKKLSLGQKARAQTEEGRRNTERLIERNRARKGQPGRKMTPEQRQEISKRFKGRRISAEHKAKTAAKHRGMKRSAETCRRISEAGKRRAPVSDETRAKLSEASRKERPELRRAYCRRAGHLLPPFKQGKKHHCRVCQYELRRFRSEIKRQCPSTKTLFEL